MIEQVESYRGQEPYVFISYAHADSEHVLPIIAQLQKEGYRVWFDEGIECGRKWAENITERLNLSSCTIAFLTENYLKSENCMDEIEYVKGKGIPTLIIYLRDLILPDWFEMRHNRHQAIFCSQYGVEDRLLKRIHEASILEVCRSHSIDKDFIVEDAVLVEYSGASEHVIIPDCVTAIGDCVFLQNEHIRTVRLPEDLTYIGDASFCACTNLETINFPKTLVNIGKDAFFGCKKLTKVILPNGLSAIRENAFGDCSGIKNLHIPIRLSTLFSDSFSGCSSLETISVADQSEMYCLFDGCLYDKLAEKLYIVPGRKHSIVFPESIKEIGRAMCRHRHIERVIIPNNIKKIEDGAFSDCTALKNIIMGDGIESIGKMAFYGCTALEKIEFPANLSGISVDKNAFINCPEIIKRYAPPQISNFSFCCNATSIFTREMSMKELRSGNGVLTIPDGITELSGDFALVFDWMPDKKNQFSFREIRIPSSVEKINGICLTEYGPDEAPVKRFKKITVSKENAYFTDIDGVLFSKDMRRLICYPCGKVGASYSVPNTVEVIEEFAFADNTNLREIILPDSLRRIEDQAFFQCAKLSTIHLPYGLEYIGKECFELSSNINRLVIPLTVKKVFTSLFSDGGVIALPHKDIELDYDYVPTEYLNMPFCGPAIISDNEMMYDFAESYDYNHFENCYEDKTRIIWADHGATLVSFPTKWDSEELVLPDTVKQVYVNAFRGSSLRKFSSNHDITVVGRTVDSPRYYEPLRGKSFHLTAGIIFCDDQKDQA